MGERQPDGDPADGEGSLAAAATDDLFVTQVCQFYRGEVDRMTTWRARLDRTTNWAVVLMAAILTFAFASPDNPHYVLLIGAIGVGAFLFIEAQRFQEYDVWRYRVRTLQRYFFAGAFRPADAPEGDWRSSLSSDLRRPELTISFVRALAHRLKRVYLPLLSVVLAAWLVRITVFQPGTSWAETARVAEIPGHLVVVGVVAGYVLLVGLALWSLRSRAKREFADVTLIEDR